MRLSTKFTLGAVTLLAVIFGICGSLMISASFDAMLKSERDSALRTYYSVQSTLRLATSISTQSDFEDVADTLDILEDHSRDMWDGILLETDAGTLYSGGIAPDRVETETGLCSVSYPSREGARLLQVSGAMTANGRKMSLYLLSDISPVYELRSTQLDTYRKLLLLTVLLGAAGAYLMSVFLTRPLTRLTRASRQIGAGDLASRAEVSSGDELETLAREFNAMADRLQGNITELTENARRQTEFMGSFAHELKTPMTSIIGYSDLIRRRMLSPEEEQEAANYIFSEGRRLESLSIKLLDLLMLKKRDFELAEASPAAIVTGVVRLLRPNLTRAGITLRYRTAEGRCMLEPDLVKSLLINLVDNARKAMDNGGAVFILSEMTDTGCVISVTDNGRGIPASDLTKITEAFYRVDKSRSRAQGGVGLGLALCDEIAKLHAGSLEIQSVEGKGTRIAAILNGGRV